jgi:hypothetical protein
VVQWGILFILLFLFTNKWYLFVSSELIPHLYAVSKHLAKQQRRITVLSQPPSTTNVCDGLNCASTDCVPVKLLGYNLNASQRRHIGNCRLKLHFRYLHICIPTSKCIMLFTIVKHNETTQLLLQQNAHFYYQKHQISQSVLYVIIFCPYMFQRAWVIFRGLNSSAWLKLLLITIY